MTSAFANTEDLQDIITRSRGDKAGYEDISIGYFFELDRLWKLNTINLTEGFRSPQLKNEWLTVSAQYVGETNFANVQLWLEGECLVRSANSATRDIIANIQSIVCSHATANALPNC